jgi:ankyrin repeat protein
VNFNHYLESGDTPLHLAVKSNREEIARYIYENVPHININDRNFMGDTPVLLAVMGGNFNLI